MELGLSSFGKGAPVVPVATLTTFVVLWVTPRPGEFYNWRELVPKGLVVKTQPGRKPTAMYTEVLQPAPALA